MTDPPCGSAAGELGLARAVLDEAGDADLAVLGGEAFGEQGLLQAQPLVQRSLDAFVDGRLANRRAYGPFA
jgi:hypothetical protein